MTPYAEIIGSPVAHSKSPAMHRFWLDRCGIGGDYRAAEVDEAGLADYLKQRRRDPAWRGCNVTRPLKTVVAEHLDILGPEARAIGAVNTVIAGEDGELTGVNTDAHGLLMALAGCDPANAALIGAGGAARAALFALKVMGVADIRVLARDLKQARKALDDLEVDGLVMPLGVSPGVDLLVNATPLGMSGQMPAPFDVAALRADAAVLDMVYVPVETPLLADARARGLRCIDGLTLLAEQGAMAFAAFFHGGPQVADTPELRAALAP